jgi:hypothetical protein
MPNDNTTTNLALRPSDNTGLSTTLMSMEHALERAARQNLEQVLATQGTSLQAFTDLEMQAMIMTEELRLTNGIDLAAIMLRGKIIKTIEDRSLYSVHPGGYRDLKHLAQEQKISISELSDTKAMYETIFPWIENTLGVPVSDIWDRVGKTNFRTMVPYLRACILGEDPDTESAANNLHRLMDTVAIEARAAGEEPADPVIRERVARQLIDAAGEDSTRVFQDRIREGDPSVQRTPSPQHQPTPAIEPTIIVIDGRRYMIAEVNEEQMTVAARKLGRHMEAPQILNLPTDPRARVREVSRNPVMRAIARAFES